MVTKQQVEAAQRDAMPCHSEEEAHVQHVVYTCLTCVILGLLAPLNAA